MISQLLIGCGVGAGAILTLGWWANHREERMIDAFLQDEEDRLVNMFELMLLGFESDNMTGFVTASPVEAGVAVMKMILHEDEQDMIVYARADGFDVSLISFQEWAHLATWEIVKAIPCIEDFDNDGFWEEDDGDEELVD